MKFFLFLFLCIATFLESVPADLAPAASVMKNGTVLHKCNAFFVCNDGNKKESRTLVTLASCVLGSSKITVGVGRNIIGHKELYNVKDIIIHPNFTEAQDVYNIAILHIEELPKHAIVYSLLNSTNYYGMTGSFPLWRFEGKTYKMIEYNVSYFPDDLYTRTTNVQLRENELAVMSDNLLKSGNFDLGSPFSFFSTPVFADNNYHVLGFLAEACVTTGTKFFKLNSIPFHYSWIVAHMK